MTTTPLMNLVLPDDHGSIDAWDVILDTVFGLIDSHNHTTGKGAKVPTGGLLIDADLSWSASGVSRAIKDLSAVDFAPVTPATVVGLAGAFFVNASDSNELYFRSVTGTNIKFTAGNALNVVQFTGGIGGDYSVVNALLSYDDATRSYWLQQEGSPRPWASMRVGNVDIYQAAASITQRVRLQSPNALAASYALTLPPAAPATGLVQPLVFDPTGIGSFGQGFALNTNQSITLSGTGVVHHGLQTISKEILGGDYQTIAGSTTTTVGQAGVNLAANSQIVLRLPDLPGYTNIVQVVIDCPTSADANSVASGTSVLASLTPPSTGFVSSGSGALFHPSGTQAIAFNPTAQPGFVFALINNVAACHVISVTVIYSA